MNWRSSGGYTPLHIAAINQASQVPWTGTYIKTERENETETETQFETETETKIEKETETDKETVPYILRTRYDSFYQRIIGVLTTHDGLQSR